MQHKRATVIVVGASAKLINHLILLLKLILQRGACAGREWTVYACCKRPDRCPDVCCCKLRFRSGKVRFLPAAIDADVMLGDHDVTADPKLMSAVAA